MESQLIRAMSKSAGKPQSGGVFELQGKSKDLLAAARPGFLVLQFKDEGLPDPAAARGEGPSRAELANEISSYLFSYLHGYKIPTHFVEKDGPTRMLVRRLEMHPLVVRVWNTAFGMLARRLAVRDGLELPFPVLEHYYKPGEPSYPLVNEFHLFATGVLKPEELRTINRLASKANAVLRSVFARRGVTLMSVALEFGVGDGQIMIGDELTPRTCQTGERAARSRRVRDLQAGNGTPGLEAYRALRDRLLGDLPAVVISS